MSSKNRGPVFLRPPTPKEEAEYRARGQQPPHLILVIDSAALLPGWEVVSMGLRSPDAATPQPRQEPAPKFKKFKPPVRNHAPRDNADISGTRAAAVKRAARTGEVFIPYRYRRSLRGVIVRKDALAGHFNALYDRARDVLHWGHPGAIRIDRETDTHVFFVRDK